MNTSEITSKVSRPAPAAKAAAGDDLSIQHYLSLILHRKWLVLIIFVLVSVGTAIVAYKLPDLYTSETLILVDPQQVPEAYVPSTVSGDVRNRLSTLSQQILSATRLQKVMDTFNLYPKERKELPREDVITLMRKDIKVDLVGGSGAREDLQAFKIAYSGEDPRIVAQVTNELASLFIEENLKAREEVATGTSDFLENQLEETRKQLEELEGKIRDFKMKHLGEMPEQEQSNISILGGLQTRLQTLSDAISRAEQQRSYLQSLAAVQPAPAAPAPGAARRQEGQTAQPQPKASPAPGTELSPAEKVLADLQSRYGDNHPDVKRQKALVEEERHLKQSAEAAQQKAEEERKSEAEAKAKESSAASNSVPAAPAAAAPQSNIPPALTAQMAAVEAEIARGKEQQQEVIKSIADYQKKLESGPVLEQEIVELLRDYDISKDHYSKLLEKKLSAEMGTQLELRQKGEKFTILDPAQVPQKPSKPNRAVIDAVGAAGGLGLGLAAALSSEFLGVSVTSAAQLGSVTGLPVLGVIPFILTPYDHRRRKRLALAGASSGLAVVLAISAFLFYHYRDRIF